MALRPWLWPGLLLSDVTQPYALKDEPRQLWEIPTKNVSFRSKADVEKKAWA